MLREKLKYKIKPFYPRFFWTECDICNKEFKKEAGWKISILSDAVFSRHICKHCAPTLKAAEIYAKDGCHVRLPGMIKATDSPPPPIPRLSESRTIGK